MDLFKARCGCGAIYSPVVRTQRECDACGQRQRAAARSQLNARYTETALADTLARVEPVTPCARKWTMGVNSTFQSHAADALRYALADVEYTHRLYEAAACRPAADASPKLTRVVDTARASGRRLNPGQIAAVATKAREAGGSDLDALGSRLGFCRGMLPHGQAEPDDAYRKAITNHAYRLLAKPYAMTPDSTSKDVAALEQ